MAGAAVRAERSGVMSKTKAVNGKVRKRKAPPEPPAGDTADGADQLLVAVSTDDAAVEPQDDVDREAVYTDSLEVSAAMERDSLLFEIQHAYLNRIAYYRSKRGGSLSLEDAHREAYRHFSEEEARERLDHLQSIPRDCISFNDLGELWGSDRISAELLWRKIKEEAQRDFESGYMASRALEPVDWMREAWRKAQYLGVRQSFVEDWQPRGGIELALIDMMAHSFFLYLHWTEEATRCAKTEPRREAEEYREWKQRKEASAKANGWLHGWWDIPYVSEQEAIEHASRMADRYNRLFLRTLRQMRDLRRYAPPVIVNNGGQVNVATDGGKQVNVAK